VGRSLALSVEGRVKSKIEQEAQGACGTHMVLKSIGLSGGVFLSTKFYIYLVLAIIEQFKIHYLCKRELYCLN